MTCAFLKFLQLHADYENQTGGYGRSSLSDRKLCNRIGMNPRTVGQREFGSLFVEDRRKVGPPKHDRLYALVLEQTVAYSIEDRTLSRGRLLESDSVAVHR